MKITPYRLTLRPRRRGTGLPLPQPLRKPVFTNERFKAYELSFSGGATLVYSAEDEG